MDRSSKRRRVESGGDMPENTLEDLRLKKAFIIDMDGVIYHGSQLCEGAKEFVQWLQKEQKQFLFLTNTSDKTPRELSQKLAQQHPGAKCYMIGDGALAHALYGVGLTTAENDVDYIVCGETKDYSFEKIKHASHLMLTEGARLIGTNPDLTDPTENGLIPGTGSLISPIELASNRKAYFIGKPNPLMMRHALKFLESTREETAIIGDRMDTDILAGIEAEIDTVLVLSGVTTDESELVQFAWKPSHVLKNVGCVVPE